MCLNQTLSLRCYILLNPFDRREAIGGGTDDFAEILWSEVQQAGVVLYFSRYPIVIYHQVAEATENFGMAFRRLLPVLFTAIVTEKLITYCQLSQKGVIAVWHFLVGVVSDDNKLVYDGQQTHSRPLNHKPEQGIYIDNNKKVLAK